MRSVYPISAMLLVLLLSTGCMGKHLKHDPLLDQVNVFGARLYADTDYKVINGVDAVEEPCLKGYERVFDSLDITVGYGPDRRIRKITTRNPGTNMFGISPGMSFEEGKQKLAQTGFREWIPPYRFKTDRYSLALLVDDKGSIFGLTLESLD
ncbi:MAG TPA: hypothetical protein PKM41_15120 [Deltaproteobacteria bacterium]|nr:hypothetical protein [Deltaproteobacteria bacterium]